MASIIRAQDGELEIEFNKKASVIDPKKTEETMIQLVTMIVNLDQRVLALEKR